MWFAFGKVPRGRFEMEWADVGRGQGNVVISESVRTLPVTLDLGKTDLLARATRERGERVEAGPWCSQESPMFCPFPWGTVRGGRGKHRSLAASVHPPHSTMGLDRWEAFGNTTLLPLQVLGDISDTITAKGWSRRCCHTTTRISAKCEDAKSRRSFVVCGDSKSRNGEMRVPGPHRCRPHVLACMTPRYSPLRAICSNGYVDLDGSV